MVISQRTVRTITVSEKFRDSMNSLERIQAIKTARHIFQVMDMPILLREAAALIDELRKDGGELSVAGTLPKTFKVKQWWGDENYPDDRGFIEWRRGDGPLRIPTRTDDYVAIICKNGEELEGRAEEFDWTHVDTGYEVAKYKIIDFKGITNE